MLVDTLIFEHAMVEYKGIISNGGEGEPMDRHAQKYLGDWVARTDRRPLVVRGARQVGKSHLVRWLAGIAFDDLLEINLEVDPTAASLFESMQPRTILPLLEARYGTRLQPGKSLLFLDEIQETPELLACLRYFYEELPELHVVAAGSLLDFALGDHEFSMPVGRIEYLHLGPMTFEEVLAAQGKASLCDYLGGFRVGDSMPESIHKECMQQLRQYMVVGGMPASVQAFLNAAGHSDSERVKQNLIQTYRDDFAKYARKVDLRRLELLFATVPRLIGTKFMYSRVDREDRARDLGRALDLLQRARVLHTVRHTAANGIPLGAEADDRVFKVIYLDVGLLCRAAGLSLVDLQSATDILLVNSGAVCEQFIGQHLLSANEPYQDPEIFCWMRQKAQSNAEVDYVIALGEAVIPLEVKAGKAGTLRSLHSFLRAKNRSFGLRFNSEPPSLVEATLASAGDDRRDFRLLSLPMYMVEQASRLCREVLGK